MVAVTVGDKLMVIQMQGADINSSDDERYGDGTGTAANQPLTTLSQANGYTVLNLAGGFEYVQVTAVAGSSITFTPPLVNAYQQNLAVQPRRTYQVIRVPQYSSMTVSGATPLTPLAWTGLVGGVLAADVAGRATFTGAGPHMDASRRGFRGGAQGVGSNSVCCTNIIAYRSTDFAQGGSKGEGIAGTPKYTSNSSAGAFDSGTRFSDPVGGFIDNTPAMSYPNGDFMRGAPANAGGGGDSHNASGGGGGNGGQGGNGSQTYTGNGLRDVGGYGGSRTPQDGVLLPTRIFMGGGGGSGSLNNDSGQRAEGGNGGGIILIRAGSIAGAGVIAVDAQRGWDSDAPNDPGGGGGAGGAVLVIAGSGHGNISVLARGGNGSDSNLETSNLAFAPPAGSQGNCCGNEQEGPGGGGGGGAVYANSALGSLSLGGGINGLSRADKALGNSGNMLAGPGAMGNSLQTIAASSIAGAREGYSCAPVLTVNKLTSTPALAVPPNTSGTYIINVRNGTTLSGVAYGVAVTDVLSAPFALTGTTAIISYSAGATGPGSPMTITGTSTVAIGTPGDPVNAFTLFPGANVTVTFKVGLNSATAGTYQNPAIVNYSDPTRITGGNVNVANPAVKPGGINAAGNTVPGSNYVSGSSTQEDIVITGVAGTSADLALTKSGPATAEVGQAVQYTLTITNSGPSNVTGSITITDTVPSAIGTVTWVCTLVTGTADAGSVVTIHSATSTLGTATADSTGNFSYKLTAVNVSTLGQETTKTITASIKDTTGATVSSSAFRVRIVLTGQDSSFFSGNSN